jgi:hypothetical protein
MASQLPIVSIGIGNRRLDGVRMSTVDLRPSQRGFEHRLFGRPPEPIAEVAGTARQPLALNDPSLTAGGLY